MARRTEDGIRFFPVNSDIVHSNKIKLTVAETGPNAWGVIFPLLCKIYREKGYWIDWCDEDVKLLLKGDCASIEMSFIDKVVAELLKRRFFNQSMFEKYGILTSDRIQENYVEAKRRNAATPFIFEFRCMTKDFFDKILNKVQTPLNNITLKKLQQKEQPIIPQQPKMEVSDVASFKEVLQGMMKEVLADFRKELQLSQPAPTVQHNHAINWPIYQQGYQHYKSLLNGKSCTEEEYNKWKEFVDYVNANEKYNDLFKSKFVTPHDFAEIVKKHSFTKDKWDAVISKILSTGIKPEHDLKFRIPDFIGYAEKKVVAKGKSTKTNQGERIEND